MTYAPIPLDEVAPLFAAGLTYPKIAKKLTDRHGRNWQAGSISAAVMYARRRGDMRFPQRKLAPRRPSK